MYLKFNTQNRVRIFRVKTTFIFKTASKLQPRVVKILKQQCQNRALNVRLSNLLFLLCLSFIIVNKMCFIISFCGDLPYYQMGSIV